ncbi:hypothetical protein COL940_010173 [Colletotrichum noveboracense]|nr:hypothetical protein COL940_010173 [Colletotrichum noveboracense]KAJ0283278.1 hypothetical protein CBS470a_007377 [Colletotrichum nupharicola]
MTAESMSPIREDYIRQLTPYTAFLAALRAAGCPAATFDLVHFSDLIHIGRLPGKTGARTVTHPAFAAPFVFKGVNFDVAGHDFREHVEKTLLHEIRTLCTLPPHPNIMPRPRILVVVPDGDVDRICGFLQPVMARDSVDEQVLRANKANTRLPLGLRAKWCYQMALAIQHTHQVAGSYHMDLKPGNMLVDGDDNVRLIDWEQSGVSMFTHPPEVTIDQEAEESAVLKNATKNKPRIIYTPHEGAPRKNQKWGFPGWNVFPEWKRTCPRAAELAEVFSLGRTMWMLLEQVEQSPDAAVWTEASKDVPAAWKAMVMRCIERDPNDRPELDEVVAFWEKQVFRDLD